MRTVKKRVQHRSSIRPAVRKLRPIGKRKTGAKPSGANRPTYNGTYNKAYDEAYDKGFNDGFAKGLEDGALDT